MLIKAKEEGKRICGYGAPGKGNTLLNYAAIGTDFLDFTVDRNPYKHGRYTPGMHIPIYPVEAIDDAKPDYILILPWNLKDEIVQQMRHVGKWGAKFIVPIPSVSIVDPNRALSLERRTLTPVAAGCLQLLASISVMSPLALGSALKLVTNSGLASRFWVTAGAYSPWLSSGFCERLSKMRDAPARRRCSKGEVWTRSSSNYL